MIERPAIPAVGGGMKIKIQTTDAARLERAGWRRVKKRHFLSDMWRSPYTGKLFHEESAVRVELMREK